MKSIEICLALVLGLFFAGQSFSQLPEYAETKVYGRTGVTCLNMPDGSSISSPTISLDDDRNVALDVNFVGGSGTVGLFYASPSFESVVGAIVYQAADIITGDPSLNGEQQAIIAVGFDSDLFLYDAPTDQTEALNSPLGVTSTSGLTLDAVDRIGGRFGFGSDGDVYGVFPVQTAGIPSLSVYAADSDIDASSPYSFLYSPDTSRVSADQLPRIAAKVSTIAGFDFEEIRLFDADGTSTLIAVETETDPNSPFSEFVTNSIAISDNGSKVAFQANDTGGTSGIYLYDDDTQAITTIASVTDAKLNSIDFFSPDVNDSGLVVFRGDDSEGLSSVFVGDGLSLFRLGGEGDLLKTDVGMRQLGRRDQNFSQSGAPQINNNGDVGWIMQYFDPTNAASVADGSLIMVSLAEACLPGDVNRDGAVDLLDVAPFVETISGSSFSCEADVNADGVVDLLDVAPFVQLLSGS